MKITKRFLVVPHLFSGNVKIREYEIEKNLHLYTSGSK